jgi:hypothetical protein|tara:strand:- start:2105 stop:2830 length:726 start_codon:yes stop_codon:yes gene_type:complete
MKNWELKDRSYVLSGGISPLTYKIRSVGMLWFDEDKKINRELRYAPNQKSLFVDEQDNRVQIEHVIFENGALYVPRTNVVLQQLLSNYHPEAGKVWEEIDELQEAVDDIDQIELELEALKLVQELEIEHLEAILRTELGSEVTTMSSKEIKRDCYLFAKNNPSLFTEIANDEDIKLRNLANRSVENGVVNLTDDNTTFKWSKTGKKILTVPFDEHPYTAFARFLKTDDGINVMKAIEKKLL